MKYAPRSLLLVFAMWTGTVFAQVEECYTLQGIPVYCDKGSTEMKIGPEHVPLFAAPGPVGSKNWCVIGQNCQVGQAWFNGPKMLAAHDGRITAFIHFFGGSSGCHNTAALCDRIRQRTNVATFQLVIGGQVRDQFSIDPSTIKMEPNGFGGFYLSPNFQESPVRIGGNLETLGHYAKAGEEISVVATSIGKGFEIYQVEIMTVAE